MDPVIFAIVNEKRKHQKEKLRRKMLRDKSNILELPDDM